MRAAIITLIIALSSTARADGAREEDAPKDAPKTTEPKKVRPARKWSISVGPSVWAASVATTIKLGPVEIHRDVPFAQIVQYFDGGMSGTLEARYGRFTATGSFQYGRLATETTKEIGGGTADLGASLTTLIAEGAVGYTVLGASDARFALELRSGLRHNATDIEANGTLGIAETTVAAQGAFHRSGTDYLIGARGRLRLNRRFAVVATGDTRIAGDSYSSWSLAGDLQVRATRWLSASAGWRVLENEATPITIRRSGPQLVVLVGF